MTHTQLKAVTLFSISILETIKETGGAPEGYIYAGSMGHMTLDTFQRLMRPLYKANAIKRDAFHYVSAGDSIDETLLKLNKIKNKLEQ